MLELCFGLCSSHLLSQAKWDSYYHCRDSCQSQHMPVLIHEEGHLEEGTKLNRLDGCRLFGLKQARAGFKQNKCFKAGYFDSFDSFHSLDSFDNSISAEAMIPISMLSMRKSTLRWPSCQAVSRTDAANRCDTDRILDTHNIPQHHLITANICNNYFLMSWGFSKFASMLCQQLQTNLAFFFSNFSISVVVTALHNRCP